jgi:hypothetical protein
LIFPRKIEKRFFAGLFFGWDQVTCLPLTNQRNQDGDKLVKLTFIGLLTALVILPGSVLGAESFSVQVGMYQRLNNAEKQCQAIRRMIGPTQIEALRIEKKGSHYAVLIGQFDQGKPARQLLSRIKKPFPQAFLWKGEYTEAQVVRRYGPPPSREKKEPEFASGPSRPTYPSGPGETGQETLVAVPGKPPEAERSLKGKDSLPGGKNNLPESSLEIRRAMIWGTVLESSPLPGNPLGLVPEKEITRVMVRVEKSEAVKGYPNFLRDKEMDELTLYAEVRQPFFIPAQKIRALVEYQGDKYKRFFWIKKAEPINP